MLSNQLSQLAARTDIATLFIERLPDKDASLARYKQAFRDLGLKAIAKFRLFRRYEIEGINQSEALAVNYQIFSELGLDRVADPTELFEQEYILAVSNSSWQQDIETISGLELLHLNFPYRRIALRRTEIFLFEEELSKSEQELLIKFFSHDKGYVKVGLKSHNFKRDQENVGQEKPVAVKTRLDIKPDALEQILQEMKVKYRKQDMADDDLLVLVGSNFRYYYFNDKMQAYLDRILMQNLASKKLQSLYKHAYDLNEIPLLASLYGLAYGSIINLDIISSEWLDFNPKEFLLGRSSTSFMLLIKATDRDRFFKFMKEVDLQAIVIGQLQKSRQVRVLYQGKEIVRLDQKTISKQEGGAQTGQRSLVGVSKRKLAENARQIDAFSGEQKAAKQQSTKAGLADKQDTVLILNYPGARNVEDLIKKLDLTHKKLITHDLTILSYDKYLHSLDKLAERIDQSDILLIPDGYNIASSFIATDKLICHSLEREPVKQAINNLIARLGKIYGLGNGFKSLLACGLLPYGRFREWGDQQAFFYYRLFAEKAGSQERGKVPASFADGKSWNLYPCLEMPFQLWQFCLEKRLILQTSDLVNLETIEALTSPNHQCLGSLNFDESGDLAKDYLK